MSAEAKEGMERELLYRALKMASAALASRDDVPSFASFFFNGKSVRAYDDELAITVRCVLPIKGGLAGRPLLAWVSGLNGTDIAVEASENSVRLKCGRSRIDLPLIPGKLEAYVDPEEQGIFVSAPLELYEGMQRCAPYMGNDSAHPWRIGMTLHIEKGKALLYATDNVAIVRAEASVEADANVEIVLLPRFVHQLLSFAKTGSVSSIRLGNGWARATFDDKTQLFSRTLGEVQAKNYARALDAVWHEVPSEVEIPARLSGMLHSLDRVLSASKGSEANLSIGKGKLSLSSDGASVSVNESAKLEGKHPEIRVKIKPKVMLSAIDLATHMAVIDRAVTLRGERFDFAMSVISED